jgi:hypothetical protein
MACVYLNTSRSPATPAIFLETQLGKGNEVSGRKKGLKQVKSREKSGEKDLNKVRNFFNGSRDQRKLA